MNAISFQWIEVYVILATTLHRFWTTLAHVQGGLFHAAQLARGLAVDGKAAARYIDLADNMPSMRQRRLSAFANWRRHWRAYIALLT